MPSLARTMRTSEQIRAEIEHTLGFFPPFFEPALPTPSVLESLWQQTLAANVESPFSALFQEKLAALLSRYGATPFLMIVHSAALHALGMTGQQVLALLDAPPLEPGDGLPLGARPVPDPAEAAAPAPDSPLETALLACATAVFLEWSDAEACRTELRRLLGPDLYPPLVGDLAYIKTCHFWIEAHPEVSFESDRRVQEHLGPMLAEEPALGDFFRHYQQRVGARRRGRERRRAADTALEAAQANTARILESITDAFVTFDREWRFTYLNDQAERLLSRTREELLGRSLWDEFPETVGTVSDHEYHRAVNEQVTVSFEQFYPPLGRRFQERAYPSGEGLSVFFQDITEQAERGRRERFLAELAERARGMTDAEEMLADAVRSVGEFLGLSRCALAEIDIEADTCTVPFDFCAGETVASIARVFPISVFGPFLVREFQAGRAVVVDDVRNDPILVSEGSVPAYDALDIRAYIAVPVVHSARTVSCIACHSAVPRRWRAEEAELVQTVVERTWLTVALTRQQRALAREAEAVREAHERMAHVLESVTEGVYVIDREWRFTYVNAQAEQMLRRAREELLGRGLWDEFPEAVGGPFDHLYHRAMEDGDPVSFEEYYAPLDIWVDAHVYPSEAGLSVFFQNISARKQAEEALRQFQFLSDSAHDAFFLMDADGRFVYANAAACDALGYTAEEIGAIGVSQVDPLYPDAEYRALFARAQAETVPPFETVHRRKDGATFPVETSVSSLQVGGRALLFAATRDISARKALEDERSRFVSLAENSMDFIGMSDMEDHPFYVNPAGLKMVGLESLGQNSPSRAIQFFHEDDRDFIMNDVLPRVLRAGHAQAEVRLRHCGTGAPIWVNYTLFTLTGGDGRPIGFGTVSRDITERKAMDAERERLARREHIIATQLQDALQPELPRMMPGLRLEKYYEAALAEAGVGGDFYDCFAIEKGCTVLAVGDLSGKGLEAAAQVATVRNMLRAFIHTRASLADAVTELNSVLASNSLLTGFATLWVGCYDGPAGELSYVNCGQEPALLRRAATGEVEQLVPTGSVIGADANSSFTERVVPLSPGDALVVFSDGATECGITRQAMLGVEGLTALLMPSFTPEEAASAADLAEAVTLRLAEGIDAASQGGLAKDDICILVAVAEGRP